MSVPEALEDLFRLVALLSLSPPIVFEEPVDDPGERLRLRTPRRIAPPLSRRHREHQHFDDRLVVDPEPSGRFPLAQTLMMKRQPHTPL
jgi:hypothetical protein